MQEKAWEKEYRNSKLVTGDAAPQAAVMRFLRWLKKEQAFLLENKKVLDLGSGTGRNSNYLASLGNEVTGLEISHTAITIARQRSKDLGTRYLLGNIGDKYPFSDNYFDLILDVTSSNSLNEKEREIYLKESSRVLKPGGYFFVRALCKEGDDNAKFLITHNPGNEKDTYILPETGIIERVWSRADFIDTYSPFFAIFSLVRETHYTRMNDRVFKRNFWIAYMRKNWTK